MAGLDLMSVGRWKFADVDCALGRELSYLDLEEGPSQAVLHQRLETVGSWAARHIVVLQFCQSDCEFITKRIQGAMRAIFGWGEGVRSYCHKDYKPYRQTLLVSSSLI